MDAITWEFKLREGVTFHDGSTFDAEDVVATFNRVPNVLVIGAEDGDTTPRNASHDRSCPHRLHRFSSGE